MNEQNPTKALGALDECIERYVETRRKNIDVFIQHHFSLKETIEIQKRSFPVDLFLNPLNALWTIPYLSVKKIIETLDKMGVTHLTPALDRLPSGVKTGYQKEIERLIANELLNCDSLIKAIKEDSILGNFFTTEQIALIKRKTEKELSSEIGNYSSSQSLISDLSSSLMTLSLGWILFGDRTLGVLGLGNKIAHKMAHDKAASGFFLGKSLGSTFYHAFPPEPSRIQVFAATLGVGFFLTALSLITSFMSDPLRKGLGLHKKNLNVLVDSLEDILFMHFRKEIKRSVKSSTVFAKTG